MDGGDFLTPKTLRQRLIDIGNSSIIFQSLYPSYTNGGILTGANNIRGGVGIGMGGTSGDIPYVLPDEYMIAGDFEPVLIWTGLCDYNYIHTQYKPEDFVPMEAVRKAPIVYPTNFKTDTFIIACGNYTYQGEKRYGYYNGSCGSIDRYESDRGNSIEAMYTTEANRDIGKLMLNLGTVTLPTTYSGVYVELILSNQDDFTVSSSWKYKNILDNDNKGEVTNISGFTSWTQRVVNPSAAADAEDVSIGKILTSLGNSPVPSNASFVQAKYYGTPKNQS